MSTLNRSATSISRSALPDLTLASSQVPLRGATRRDLEAWRGRRWGYWRRITISLWREGHVQSSDSEGEKASPLFCIFFFCHSVRDEVLQKKKKKKKLKIRKSQGTKNRQMVMKTRGGPKNKKKTLYVCLLRVGGLLVWFLLLVDFSTGETYFFFCFSSLLTTKSTPTFLKSRPRWVRKGHP